MPKLKTVYACQNCGFESLQWQGQCPDCGEWNTFIENVVESKPSPLNMSAKKSTSLSTKTIKIKDIKGGPVQRITSGIGEFDRVLGDGFVPGQVILLGGAPGIGKSTLLIQIAKSMAPKQILYVCGEESVYQISHRISRMNYKGENLLMLPETNIDAIVGSIEENKNDLSLVIVDSIQTLYSSEFTGISGSLTQVRGCTQILTAIAKSINIPVVLVGHVTKEGLVAGPKILEHIVDTVLYLEGDSQYLYRILRTNKNRFGPISEIGLFEMNDAGMNEILNPSELFLSNNIAGTSGSCITVVMEGYRPLMFEIQALTVKTSFGYPRRTTSGLSNNRLQVLLAILEKRCGLNLSSHDVYVNVAGGFKVNEYASDLAVCVAVASAFWDKPLKDNTVIFGECGLSGEIRSVSHQEKRIKEAKKLGYATVISSSQVNTIKQALQKLFK